MPTEFAGNLPCATCQKSAHRGLGKAIHLEVSYEAILLQTHMRGTKRSYLGSLAAGLLLSSEVCRSLVLVKSHMWQEPNAKEAMWVDSRETECDTGAYQASTQKARSKSLSS